MKYQGLLKYVLILTVIFIEDIATKIGVFIMVVIVIISVYAAFMFKEVHTNSSEIKKINEKIDIYERLNKLEAKIFKGDKNE